MPTPATKKIQPSTGKPAQRLDTIIRALKDIVANRELTDRQIGALLTQIGRIDQQLGRWLLMPKKKVGCYFDVFETALMKLSADNEPTVKDAREVLDALKRFQAKMLSIAPTEQTNLVEAIAQVSKAIRKDVQRRTSPASDTDYSVFLDHLDAATRSLSDADVNAPEEMKRAIKGLIGAARTLGKAL